MKKNLLFLSIVFVGLSIIFLTGNAPESSANRVIEHQTGTQIVSDIPTKIDLEKLKEEQRKKREEQEKKNFVIVIDAGHQLQGNSQKEPVGPGSSTMKAKIASGTRGTTTGVAEYELTLEVSLKLQDALEKKGYSVIMIRTTHNVDISNAKRAEIANNAGADVFIRIHANGSNNPSVNGAMTICSTPNNPYYQANHEQSKVLSTYVLDNFVKQTGCRKEKVWQTDTMSGINWCKVPVTILEMGYMTNPKEDQLMQTDAYQEKMVTGIVQGIEQYRAVYPS